MNDHALQPRIDALQAKLDLAILYLKALDLPHHAEGADWTPPGWNITVAELIWRLENDESSQSETNH